MFLGVISGFIGGEYGFDRNNKVWGACRERTLLVNQSAKPIITGKNKANRVVANDNSFAAVAKAA